jgi:hypothetical protein
LVGRFDRSLNIVWENALAAWHKGLSTEVYLYEIHTKKNSSSSALLRGMFGIF